MAIGGAVSRSASVSAVAASDQAVDSGMGPHCAHPRNRGNVGRPRPTAHDSMGRHASVDDQDLTR